ncbi:hypothetical protein ElyMa_004484300 [Elysia marginata]|uniref:Secreted protein n=1 Tax=Elysia marginata TaxID=1093978 RepID=A0AAV4HKP7_9GAST|nr:hypothetical protein ElyMa_004484300 [Elysia marginata]
MMEIVVLHLCALTGGSTINTVAVEVSRQLLLSWLASGQRSLQGGDDDSKSRVLNWRTHDNDDDDDMMMMMMMVMMMMRRRRRRRKRRRVAMAMTR